MSFPSQYATQIWDTLYTVDIPDDLTLNRDYIRKFGVYSTGDPKKDAILSNRFVTVKIPVITIMEYFLSGMEIRIKSRQDLNAIYKSIQNYLQEWRDYMKYNLNTDEGQYKELLISLDKLGKYIYDKLSGDEVVERIFTKKPIGIQNPLDRLNKGSLEPIEKPEYEGLTNIVKGKTRQINQQSRIKGTTTRY